MNIIKLKKENYQWVKDNIPRPAECIKSITYIEELAQYSNTDIRTWDLMTMFKGTTDAGLLVDRRSINKRFFIGNELTEEKFNELSSNDRDILEKAELLLRGKCPRDTLKKIQNLKNHIGTLESSLASENAQLQRLEFESFSNVRPKKPLHEQVRNMINGPWRIEHLDIARIHISTKNDVIVSHKDKKMGIDITLNLGKFAFVIDMWRRSVKPERDYHRDVTWVDDNYCHPHVGNCICFGSEGTKLSKAWENQDFEEVSKILYGILTQYCDDNPHRSLSCFFQEQIRNGKLPNVRDKDGYDIFGYNKDGYNMQGFNQKGFNKEGWNRNGWNAKKQHRDGQCNECEEWGPNCCCDEDKCECCNERISHCECGEDPDDY